MSHRKITVTEYANWARLTICRADKHNALSLALADEMTAALRHLAGRPEIRAVVLTGEGEKMFCAGFDITAMPVAANAPEGERFSRLAPVENLFGEIAAFPYPVIAQINGSAFGAGCELALCCDLRVAADDARMGMPPVKLGVVYPWWGLKRFVDALGLAAAQQLFLTGRPVSGRRLMEMGLVHHRVPRTGLADFTAKLAREVEARSKRSRFITLSQAATKSSTNFSFASSQA
jgi:enoyl-CoA hydratase